MFNCTKETGPFGREFSSYYPIGEVCVSYDIYRVQERTIFFCTVLCFCLILIFYFPSKIRKASCPFYNGKALGTRLQTPCLTS